MKKIKFLFLITLFLGVNPVTNLYSGRNKREKNKITTKLHANFKTICNKQQQRCGLMPKSAIRKGLGANGVKWYEDSLAYLIKSKNQLEEQISALEPKKMSNMKACFLIGAIRAKQNMINCLMAAQPKLISVWFEKLTHNFEKMEILKE